MARRYLETSVVDATFNAHWRYYGRSPKTVHIALRLTKDQINGKGNASGRMPPTYVPPPWRVQARSTVSASVHRGPALADIERARMSAERGRRKLSQELDALSKQHFGDLPRGVVQQLLLIKCGLDPGTRDLQVRTIIHRNWGRIEAHRSRNPKAGPSNCDTDCMMAADAQREAAIARLQSQSFALNAPGGREAAKRLVATQHAVMVMDLDYLTKNTFAGGFYGVARERGADHDSAMEHARAMQNMIDVMNIPAAGLSGGGSRRGASRVPIRSGHRAAPRFMKNVRTGSYFRESGMTRKHQEAFQAAAKTSRVFAVVRLTKPAGIPLIERGAPAKGMDLSKAGIKCAADSGVATARNESQIKAARALGYAVVDKDGVARDKNGQAMQLNGPAVWDMKPGQVVDAKLKKPVVGDYDVMDIIDPKSPGRRLVAATSNGQTLPDQTNPQARAFRSLVNSKMDQPRVLHGAHADYSGLPNEGALVFRPDGTVMLLPDRAAVQGFYQSMGRATRQGSYTPAGKVTVGVE